MTRYLQVAALTALFFVVANRSEANGPSGGHKGTSGHQSSHQTYHSSQYHHGPSMTYSHDHRWSSRYWNPRYRCEYCYSSYDRCYFYYYAPANCYYPVSYIDQYPPTPVQAPPAGVPMTAVPTIPLPTPVVNVNQNTNVVR